MFSIVIPVYNTEKYLSKCLDSVLNQTYQNYEIILVNDGSLDNSQSVIEKYSQKSKKIKYYSKENGGLSDARNFGVTKATGDYLIFLDSDDSYEPYLLEKVKQAFLENDNVEIVKFQLKKILMNGTEENIFGDFFVNQSANLFFESLSKNEMFEPACLYAFQMKFWKKNYFLFEKGRFHEDFGLIPLVLISAKGVTAIPYIGYRYLIRENSIITNTAKEKELKKIADVLYFFDMLVSRAKEKDLSEDLRKVFYSFLANEVFFKIKKFKGREKRIYLNELKKRKIWNYLLVNTFLRKLKKFYIMMYIVSMAKKR